VNHTLSLGREMGLAGVHGVALGWGRSARGSAKQGVQSQQSETGSTSLEHFTAAESVAGYEWMIFSHEFQSMKMNSLAIIRAWVY
jgi:hypothetical protein